MPTTPHPSLSRPHMPLETLGSGPPLTITLKAKRMPSTTPPRDPGTQPNSYRTGPDERGFFGKFGGRFVAETLMPLILELERAYEEAKGDPAPPERY